MPEDDEELQQVLFQVFGQSDSESDSDEQVPSGQSWSRKDGIPGLWLHKGFMTARQQRELLSAIEAEGWFIDAAHNQAMRFKELPRWVLQLSSLIYNSLCSYAFASDASALETSEFSSHDLPLRLDLLSRVPFFDQMIINRYQPGEGICAHVDLLRFEDGIAILSLESMCIMHFSPCLPTSIGSEGNRDQQARHTYAMNDEYEGKVKVPVLLEPGDLILLSGEARYNWTHEINRSEACQVWEGETITQMRRTSVTLRKLSMQKHGGEV